MKSLMIRSLVVVAVAVALFAAGGTAAASPASSTVNGVTQFGPHFDAICFTVPPVGSIALGFASFHRTSPVSLTVRDVLRGAEANTTYEVFIEHGTASICFSTAVTPITTDNSGNGSGTFTIPINPTDTNFDTANFSSSLFITISSAVVFLP